MADIDVVPKHRSSAWIWWVIAIVVLGAILWYAFAGRTRTGARLNGSIGSSTVAAVVVPAFIHS